MNYNINFEWNPLLIIPAMAIAIGLSYFLYRKDKKLPQKTRKVLLPLRAILFTLLFLILLNPIIKHFENTVEKPAFVVALDNSQSIANALSENEISELKSSLLTLKKEIEEKDIQFEMFNAEGRSIKMEEDFQFEAQKTDLSGQLKEIEKKYENRNLSGILLVSDGLFNRGVSPVYANYKNRISVLGVGDTSEKKDVWINEIDYNEIAFLDNFYPIRVRIQQSGLQNQELRLKLKSVNKVLAEKSFAFSEGENLKTIDLKVLAEKTGQRRLTIEVEAENENPKLKANNSRDIYLEIIDGRDKILIAAMAPHPDIKAIKSALEQSSNFEIETVFLTKENIPDEKFDLVILHQVPNVQNIGNAIVPQLISKKIPLWFILGPSSDYFALGREWNGVVLKSRVRQSDEVNPLLNPNFDKYEFPELSENLFNKLPPMRVPFAKYELGEATEVVLYQSVGRINTGKPLLALQQFSGNKYAFLAGDDLWSWRIYEYAENENFQFTDALINKTVQFLSLKEDKRKFRIRIKDQSELYEGMPLVIQTEIYNDIFEPVYNKEVKIVLKNENKQSTEYSYVHTKSRNFKINGLEPGVYSYRASTEINDEIQMVNGQFVIRKMELESLISKADFEFLRKIAERNGGIFVNHISEQNIGDIIGDQSSGVIHSREVNIDIISLFWLFFLALLLVSAEWFARKYSGSY